VEVFEKEAVGLKQRFNDDKVNLVECDNSVGDVHFHVIVWTDCIRSESPLSAQIDRVSFRPRATIEPTIWMLRCGPSNQSYVHHTAFWQLKRRSADKAGFRSIRPNDRYRENEFIWENRHCANGCEGVPSLQGLLRGHDQGL
jgi:hypothetical protein